MRALAYDRFRGPVDVRDLPAPQAPPGGVVVEVHAAGLCRSDWHAWMGHDDDVAVFPHVPGHEFAGRVVETGAGVDPGWRSQMVTAPFVQACGRCSECRRGAAQVCPHQVQPGFDAPGAFAERVVVTAAETNLVALPDGLAPELAAGLGCRVATAYRAVADRAAVAAGEWVVVVGCGGVGLAAVAVARSRGARVVAVDAASGPLVRAQALGAEAGVVAGAGVDVAAAVHELTGGGAAVSLDCLGTAATCRSAVLSLGRRGRHVQVGLLPPQALADERGQGPVPMHRVIAWELDVLGSHGMAAADYPRLLAEVAAGSLPLDGLMDPRTPLRLAEAGVVLAGMDSVPSDGIRVLDPRA